MNVELYDIVFYYIIVFFTISFLLSLYFQYQAARMQKYFNWLNKYKINIPSSMVRFLASTTTL